MRIQSRTAVPDLAPTAPSSAYLWWVMTSIVLGGYINVLNNHVINVVIPKMMSGLGTDVVTIREVMRKITITRPDDPDFDKAREMTGKDESACVPVVREVSA